MGFKQRLVCANPFCKEPLWVFFDHSGFKCPECGCEQFHVVGDKKTSPGLPYL